MTSSQQAAFAVLLAVAYHWLSYSTAGRSELPPPELPREPHLDPLPRVQLPWLSVEKARALHGKRCRVSFGADAPPYTVGEFTVCGPADRGDGIERVVMLRGADRDVEGKWLSVVGTLRVIDHPAAVVNGVAVPGWTEIRLEEE